MFEDDQFVGYGLQKWSAKLNKTLTDAQVDATVIDSHIEGEKFWGDLHVHLNAKKSKSNRLEVGEKDDEVTIKDLRIGAEKSDVQDQNLVPQNSVQRLAVLDDYSFPNQRSCNSADLQCQHFYASWSSSILRKLMLIYCFVSLGFDFYSVLLLPTVGQFWAWLFFKWR